MFPFAENDTTRGRYLTHARWEAVLSDGRLAVQQDEGDGTEGEASSWLQLKSFCEAEGLSVAALRLRFRSHVVQVGPQNAQAYFFRPGVVGFMAGPTTKVLYAGYLDEASGLVRVTTLLAPALEVLVTDERDPADPVAVGPSLIRAISPS